MARKNADIYDSFSFFPQINMECEIIRHLIAFDLGRNLTRLLKQERTFREWYDEHFSIALELYIKMKENLGDDAPLLPEAEHKVNEITNKAFGEIDRRLAELLDSDTLSDRRRRRSLTYTVYSLHGCSWNNVGQDTLSLAERCFRKNVLERDGMHGNSDIETWFELYRRTKYFQASDAQSLIADYMEDG